MGANASTAVPVYASGEVLDAARLNLTNAGIPVFGGTALRDAAFGDSGEKVLAEGQFCYLEDSDTTQFYSGAEWQTVGVPPGLVLVATATASAVNSVSINNCFTSSYANYKINANITASVGTNSVFSCRFRIGGVDTSTNYKQELFYQNSTTVTGLSDPAGTDELEVGLLDATGKSYFNAYNYHPNNLILSERVFIIYSLASYQNFQFALRVIYSTSTGNIYVDLRNKSTNQIETTFTYAVGQSNALRSFSLGNGRIVCWSF